MNDRALLATPLALLTRCVLSRPRWVLLLGLLIAVVSITLAATRLGFRGNRLDLLNPASSYNRRWLAYLDEFGVQDDVVVAVSGQERSDVEQAMSQVAERLAAEPERFESILFQRELGEFRRKGLHYLPPDEFERIEQLVARGSGLLNDNWRAFDALAVAQQAGRQLNQGRVTRLPETASAKDDERANAEFLGRYVQSLLAAMQETDSSTTPWNSALNDVRTLADQFRTEFLVEDDGTLGLVVLHLVNQHEGNSIADIRRLREIVSEVRQQTAAELGLTGMPVLEADEMQSSTSDTVWASGLSLAGVACIFVAGFGSVRRPLLAVVVLMLSLAWTMGYITMAVGHLNILSAAFGVIIIGLGIDFSIHYLACYGQQLTLVPNCREALVETGGAVGPGIVTGGVTTALAFCTAALTDFTGIVELGLIAAGGILLCLAATLIVLPALIVVADSIQAPRAPLRWVGERSGHQRRAVLLFVVALLLTGVAADGLRRLRYDHNLLNLQPAQLESVALERVLSTRLHRGVWYAVSVANDRDELLARKAALQDLPAVVACEDLVSAVPTVWPGRPQRIASLAKRIEVIPEQPPLIPVGLRSELLPALSSIAVLLDDPEQVARQLEQIAQLSDTEYFRRLSQFQQQAASSLLQSLVTVRNMADVDPPMEQDLPEPLRKRFLGRTGKHLLRVFGHGDIWEMRNLEQFVRSVEAVDPFVTGHPIQTFYASRQMQRSYVHAAVYSLIAVSIVLMLDFRKIRFWLLASIPMSLGFVQMLGLLGWLNIPLNAANMIVLPLILGIGIDDGVHVVHDFLRHGKKNYRLANSTATAIILTSATTMVGFGSLMFASHRGLRSLGQVLTIGILCCLISSIMVLPPLLRWIGGSDEE
jgi:hypothetical protein